MNNIKKFSDFDIKSLTKAFTGDKIRIDKILNTEILVHEYKIETSKFEQKGNGKCLYLQIERKGELFIVFSGSVKLQEQIQQVPPGGFPFETTIIKQDERFVFT